MSTCLYIIMLLIITMHTQLTISPSAVYLTSLHSQAFSSAWILKFADRYLFRIPTPACTSCVKLRISVQIINFKLCAGILKFADRYLFRIPTPACTSCVKLRISVQIINFKLCASYIGSLICDTPHAFIFSLHQLLHVNHQHDIAMCRSNSHKVNCHKTASLNLKMCPWSGMYSSRSVQNVNKILLEVIMKELLSIIKAN